MTNAIATRCTAGLGVAYEVGVPVDGRALGDVRLRYEVIAVAHVAIGCLACYPTWSMQPGPCGSQKCRS